MAQSRTTIYSIVKRLIPQIKGSSVGTVAAADDLRVKHTMTDADIAKLVEATAGAAKVPVPDYETTSVRTVRDVAELFSPRPIQPLSPQPVSAEGGVVKVVSSFAAIIVAGVVLFVLAAKVYFWCVEGLNALVPHAAPVPPAYSAFSGSLLDYLLTALLNTWRWFVNVLENVRFQATTEEAVKHLHAAFAAIGAGTLVANYTAIKDLLQQIAGFTRKPSGDVFLSINLTIALTSFGLLLVLENGLGSEPSAGSGTTVAVYEGVGESPSTRPFVALVSSNTLPPADGGNDQYLVRFQVNYKSEGASVLTKEDSKPIEALADSLAACVRTKEDVVKIDITGFFSSSPVSGGTFSQCASPDKNQCIGRSRSENVARLLESRIEEDLRRRDLSPLPPGNIVINRLVSPDSPALLDSLGGKFCEKCAYLNRRAEIGLIKAGRCERRIDRRSLVADVQRASVD